ncbi:MAG: twin-arginine translocase TatA/TatE family subunit [Erythrobacter sp.]|uniref:twin-arginine translocase TatA/TatE family subunit n=1 Tax=Erythrobacter sp. HL-111 TaxID=1798193 RepID=UPI0006D9A17B|nr:twin-arginine translocase TatA/TatE family subunit [Erythrobacter sp. HL-111]KPP89748.1 MAG: sec-independent protein translocase protein TatA [Erythrobacteraceae bacterium HL-111]SDT11531.1 sec-independent protein translocase protein TatA [Erythrobacter sp. HL-111]
MGGIGIWQILIIALVVLVLFGRGRISEMMGDFGKGISSFKKGMSEEDSPSDPANAKRIEAPANEVPAGETRTGEPSEKTGS